MSRSQQPSKPFRRRNRRLVGSFNALAFAEKADKGPEKILQSVPLTSSRSLSENAPSFVLSATSDHGEDGRHHYRQFLDGKPKEEFPGRFKPVQLSVNKVADSVRCPSSPNGIVASALRPNTLGSLIASQNQPKVTLQPPQSLPVATPLGPKLDAPAVRTLRSSQPKPDTSTSHGQKNLPSTTPSQLNLDMPVVSTVNSLQPNPVTPTSHGQKRLPLVTPLGSNLDIPACHSPRIY
ncbi:hypothetical protein F5141DRAFT_1288778 [Pisolithus sp. B1]|nr:hypothetical protein F5141DRAFT_1288778 [Pisolithus sp. B1]